MYDERLLSIAGTYRERARAPFSRDEHVVLLLLSDGTWIPGVRVDSASFQLTIAATVNAVTTAYALGRTDVAALWSNRALSASELLYVQGAFPGRPVQASAPHAVRFSDSTLPEPSREVPATIACRPELPGDMITCARTIAAHAHVPSSDFPVGCIVPTGNQQAVPGVNVEHPEWSWILCAERNALGTMVSYGLTEPDALVLSCLKDDQGTPCGACRQLIMELAPGASVWMDRGNRPPERMEAVSMLPHFFTGRALTPD